MSMVRRFEDLVAWQKARLLTRAVYEATRLPRFAKDFGLCSQLQRAAVSTMSNVAEGFERGRRKEFHQALSTAKASCAEVRSLLCVAADVEYIDAKTFKDLTDQASEVSRIIGGLRAAVQRQIASEPARLRRSTQSSVLSPENSHV